MSDDADMERPYRDPVGLRCAHLLTCRNIWYNPEQLGQAFGLAGIYACVDLPDGATFPVRLDRVFVYFRLWGDPGTYRLWVRLVKIDTDEDNDEVEVQLGADDQPREFSLSGSPVYEISGLNYTDDFAAWIGLVPFRESGLYEYQLWADGFDEPIARERVMAREWKYDE